jgi:membrane-bound lytic murein transglycosylase B
VGDRRRRRIVALAVALVAATSATAATRAGDRPLPVPTAAPPATAFADRSLPALDERVPLGPRTLAATLRRTSARLDAEVDRWRREGDLAAARPPLAVTRLATYEQRIVGVLARHPRLSPDVVRRLPHRYAHRVAPEVRALRDLQRLHGISQRRPGPPPRIRLGRPQPAAVLMGHYRAAQRRFGVGWHVLAAVNLVETRFGRYRNESISGARGPMQFMPATWRAYGMGGDVLNTRDAIMGAANYLRASGAPRDYRRALHAYNPSSLYVRTVRMYANRMARDPRAYPSLYAREVVRSRR